MVLHFLRVSQVWVVLLLDYDTFAHRTDNVVGPDLPLDWRPAWILASVLEGMVRFLQDCHGQRCVQGNFGEDHLDSYWREHNNGWMRSSRRAWRANEGNDCGSRRDCTIDRGPSGAVYHDDDLDAHSMINMHN